MICLNLYVAHPQKTVQTRQIKLDEKKRLKAKSFGSFLRFTDGRILIRELATKSQMKGRMFVKRLEFSCRYWKTLGIYKRKIAIGED